MIPLYKKGNKENPANFQLIRLLSSLGKFLEKIIHKQMNDVKTKFSSLCPAQYGFRDKLSCVGAIAAVTEYMRSEVGKKA